LVEKQHRLDGKGGGGEGPSIKKRKALMSQRSSLQEESLGTLKNSSIDATGSEGLATGQQEVRDVYGGPARGSIG